MESLVSAVRLLEIAHKSSQSSKDLKKIEEACDAALTAANFCSEFVDEEEQLKFLNANATKIRPEYLKYLGRLIAPPVNIYYCLPAELDINLAFLLNVSGRVGGEVCTIESGERYLALTAGIGAGQGIGASIAILREGERNNRNSSKESPYAHSSFIGTFSLGLSANAPLTDDTKLSIKDISGVGVGIHSSVNLNVSVPVLPLTQNDDHSAKSFLTAIKKE